MDLEEEKFLLRSSRVIGVPHPLELFGPYTLGDMLVVEREVDKLLDLVSKDNFPEVDLPLLKQRQSVGPTHERRQGLLPEEELSEGCLGFEPAELRELSDRVAANLIELRHYD